MTDGKEPQEPVEVPNAEEKPRGSCEIEHSICVQCGTQMNLVKTKWICPTCRWIIGCCD